MAPELGLSLKGIPIDQARTTAAKYGIDIDASKGISCVCEDRHEREGDPEEGDAMLLMSNEGNLEDLVSIDVLQSVTNIGGNTLNESRLCKGLLFNEACFVFNRYTNHDFHTLMYDVETDLLVTSTIVRMNHMVDYRGIPLKRVFFLYGIML